MTRALGIIAVIAVAVGVSLVAPPARAQDLREDIEDRRSSVLSAHAAPSSQRAARAQDPPPPNATLLDRSPWVDVGGTLDVALDLTGPVRVDRIEVQVHGPLESSPELDESGTGDVGPVLFTGTFPVADLDDLGGDDRGLRLDVSDTVNEGATVRMAYAGVYPLVITPIAADGTPGRSIRTPVIRRSGAGTTLDAPELYLAVDMAAVPSTPPDAEHWSWTLGPDELGRLHRLVDAIEAAGPAAVSALVSGSTAAGLAAQPGGPPPRITEVTDVVALPTVPFDWTATTRSGLGPMRPGMIEQGRNLVATTFSGTIDETIWDGRDGLDADDLDDIAAAGFERVLVSSTFLRNPDTPDADPGAIDAADALAVPMVAEVDGAPDDLDVLVVDERISDLLQTPITGADAAHVAVADLVLRAGDSPGPIAAVVDAAPAGSVLTAALPFLARPDSPVTLHPLTDDLDIGDGDGDTGESDVHPVSVTLLPPGGETVDDIQALARRIRSAASSVDTYAAVIGPEDDSVDRARALVAASLHRGLTRPQREQMLTAVEELTGVTFDGVGFTGPVDHNLTSRTGSLPIGILNDSAVPVTMVLTASSDRLAFPDGDGEECATSSISSNNQVCRVVTVPPGEVRIDLPVEALATGSVPMSVELRSPDGTTVFAIRQLNVRSTAISGTGLVLSLGAVAVLLVWWVRTVLARRRDGTATETDVG